MYYVVNAISCSSAWPYIWFRAATAASISSGVFSSVDEVTRYKQSVMKQHSVSLAFVGSRYGAPIFAQFVADNVDHNVRTSDGYDTFHEWGLFLPVFVMVILLQLILSYLSWNLRWLLKTCVQGRVYWITDSCILQNVWCWYWPSRSEICTFANATRCALPPVVNISS